MSSYARVAHGIWGDERFRGLSSIKPSGQSLWLFLITGPHNRGVPGLFLTSRSQIAERLKWSVRDVERCFAEIDKAGMAVADWANGVVWLPRGVRHDRPGNPNVVAGWWRQLSPMPECELVVRAIRGLRDWCIVEGKGWVEAFDKGLSKAFHEGFREGVLKGVPKDCNARVPSPCPSPSPLGSREPLRERGEPQSDPDKSSADPPPTEAEDTSPAGDAALMAAWNAARARRGMPPSRMGPRHREAFTELRAAFGEDPDGVALCGATIAAYHASDDAKLSAAGWTANLWAFHVDGAMAKAIEDRKRAAPPVRPVDARILPSVPGATAAELAPYARSASQPFSAEEEGRIAEEVRAKRAAPAEASEARWRPPALPAELLAAVRDVPPEDSEAERRRRALAELATRDTPHSAEAVR